MNPRLMIIHYDLTSQGSFLDVYILTLTLQLICYYFHIYNLKNNENRLTEIH